MKVKVSVYDSREPGVSIGELDITAGRGRDINLRHPISSDANRTLAETELLLIEKARSLLDEAQNRDR